MSERPTYRAICHGFSLEKTDDGEHLYTKLDLEITDGDLAGSKIFVTTNYRWIPQEQRYREGKP